MTRDVPYYCPDPRKLQLEADALAMGLSTARSNLRRNKPHRMIDGIVISSARKNTLGMSFAAAGMQWTGEVPLIVDHEPYSVLGAVRRAWAVGESVRFSAEIMNGDLRYLQNVESVWQQLRQGAAPDVSVGTKILRVAADDSTVVTSWELREISIISHELSGADRGARVTSVFEKAHVIYSDSRPAVQYHWREAA